MARSHIEIQTGQLDRLTSELSGFGSEVGESAYHALNRTIDHVITQTGRLVTKDYAVKAKEVKESFRGGIKRPTRSDLTANLVARGKTLTLGHFPHSPSSPPTSGRKYKVKVTIKRSEGRQTIKTTPHPFVAPTGTTSSDGTQYNIFKREGRERLPITVLRTLSIPQMISSDNISDKIQQAAQEKLDERLEHEITRRMTSIDRNIRR